ncbi:MAG: hypothetical protein HOV80_22520 [Polyangiaceae bacterium]|nr:hypothetical protein [Polyangiaceae bacterium]
MTLDLPEPRHADKGLYAGFVMASLFAHAAIVLLVALFGASRGYGGGALSGGPPRDGIASDNEVAIAEQDDEVAVDELAANAGQAAPEAAAQPEPVATTEEVRVETFEVPTAPTAPTSSASAVPPPAPPKPPKPKAPRLPSSATAAASGSAATPAGSASAGAGSGDLPGEGEGHAKKAPNLAERFTHELPRYAHAIEDWEKLESGPAGSIRATLVLDADGKIVQTEDPVPSKPTPPAALAEAVRRVAKGLRMTLALPGHPVHAGKLEVTVSAKVEHGAPQPQPDELGLGREEFKGKKGRSWFWLRSGLKVTFDVTIEQVTLDEP